MRRALQRLLELLVGRKEPEFDFEEKDRRIRVLSMKAEVMARRGKR